MLVQLVHNHNHNKLLILIVIPRPVNNKFMHTGLIIFCFVYLIRPRRRLQLKLYSMNAQVIVSNVTSTLLIALLMVLKYTLLYTAKALNRAGFRFIL